MHTISIVGTALKEALELPQTERFLATLLKLAQDPRPMGVEKMAGMERTYRVRIGDYRVVYEIDDKAKTVTIVKVGHRREVYR